MNKKINYLFAFFIPFFLLLIILIIFKMYPYGDKTLLTIDMDGQYISFFSYYKRILLGSESIIYSFSKTMGGDMIGLFSYYLLSPLNLILFLCNTKSLPIGILLITLLKVGFSGLTMYIYINKTFKNKTIPKLLFSTSYALMAYNFVYFQNIMWIDGVILLPLVILGINDIFENNNPLKYVVFLFLSIFTNYYIGYMICIFCLLYFLFKLFELKCDLRQKIKHCLKFISYSLLVVLLTMFLLLPNIFSLIGGKGVFSLSDYSLTIQFSFLDFLTKFFNGSFTYNQIINGLPNIYSGMLINILCVFYFVNPKIKKSKKIYAALFLGVIFISFSINILDNIWHLFKSPVWFPYRYSFVFSFFMILIAIESFINIKYVKTKSMITFLICSILLFLLVFYTNWNYNNFLTDSFVAVINICLLILIIILLLLYNKEKLKKIVLLILVLFVSCDLVLNGVTIMSCFEYKKQEDYENYLKNMESVINMIQKEDKTFYRLESNFKYSQNDAMLLGYSGLSHFSSTEKLSVRNFMSKMGFKNTDMYAYYNLGTTESINSLLGIKYILSKHELDNQYTFLSKKNNIYIYENKNVLPIVFMSYKNILDVDTSKYNAFELQNEIYSSLINKRLELYTKLKDVKIKYENVEQSSIENKYYKLNPEKQAFISFDLKSYDEGPIYAYFNSKFFKEVKLYVNGKYISPYFNYYHHNIINLGNYEKGEKIKLVMILQEDEVYFDDYLFYYHNVNLLEKINNTLSNTKVNKINDYKLEISVQNNSFDYLFTSIPYEKGWNVYIDGEKVKIQKILDSLLGIELPKGEHQIELIYFPKGLILGFTISLITIIFILIKIFLKKWKKCIE